jgi:hypothetical protein
MLASVCLQGDVGREARFWGGDHGTTIFQGTGARGRLMGGEIFGGEGMVKCGRPRYLLIE